MTSSPEAIPDGVWELDKAFALGRALRATPEFMAEMSRRDNAVSAVEQHFQDQADFFLDCRFRLEHPTSKDIDVNELRSTGRDSEYEQAGIYEFLEIVDTDADPVQYGLVNNKLRMMNLLSLIQTELEVYGVWCSFRSESNGLFGDFLRVAEVMYDTDPNCFEDSSPEAIAKSVGEVLKIEDNLTDVQKHMRSMARTIRELTRWDTDEVDIELSHVNKTATRMAKILRSIFGGDAEIAVQAEQAYNELLFDHNMSGLSQEQLRERLQEITSQYASHVYDRHQSYTDLITTTTSGS